MDMEDLVICSICMERFDENVRPRSLPCGHTFCTDCINNGIEGGLHSCANCKKEHQASNGCDFPINYTAEILVSGLNQAAQLGTMPRRDRMTAAQPCGSTGLGRKMQALICDQKDQRECLLKISEETKKDIREYKSYINESKAKHTQFIEKILAIVQHHEEINFQLQKEDKRVTDFLKQIEDSQKEAHESLRKVDNITNASHILASSEEVEKVHDDLVAWNEKCKMQFPCTDTIKRSQKVIRKTTEVLNLYEKDEEESTSSNEGLIQSGLSIMGKIMTIDEKLRIDNYKHLNLKSLQAISKSTMEILDRGQAFALQRNGSHIRSGHISISNGNTYLHCLREFLPPAEAFTISYDEVMETINTDSVLTFMDLAWEGSVKGRIHILLSPQTPLATHFWNLCMAHLGPSYLHTRFTQAYNFIGRYISVTGGDYENDDGSGGAPLFQELQNDSKVYSREIKPGSVGIVDYDRDGPRSAQFKIFTNGFAGSTTGIFGQVQDRLDLVEEAARLDDIKKVQIEDCGIVLSY